MRFFYRDVNKYPTDSFISLLPHTGLEFFNFFVSRSARPTFLPRPQHRHPVKRIADSVRHFVRVASLSAGSGGTAIPSGTAADDKHRENTVNTSRRPCPDAVLYVQRRQSADIGGGGNDAAFGSSARTPPSDRDRRRHRCWDCRGHDCCIRSAKRVADDVLGGGNASRGPPTVVAAR